MKPSSSISQCQEIRERLLLIHTQVGSPRSNCRPSSGRTNDSADCVTDSKVMILVQDAWLKDATGRDLDKSLQLPPQTLQTLEWQWPLEGAFISFTHLHLFSSPLCVTDSSCLVFQVIYSSSTLSDFICFTPSKRSSASRSSPPSLSVLQRQHIVHVSLVTIQLMCSTV